MADAAAAAAAVAVAVAGGSASVSPRRNVLSFHRRVTLPLSAPRFPRVTFSLPTRPCLLPRLAAFGGDGPAGGAGGGGGGGGGDKWNGNGDGGMDGGGGGGEAMLALTAVGRELGSVPKELAEAIIRGEITPEILCRYLEMEKSPLLRWLLQFGGFQERLLADDLFLAKIAMEVGVGVFAKCAAELEKRKGNFVKELDFVIADVIMAMVADFMLVWLPAPTVSLRRHMPLNAGPIAKFFAGCPDNAFQVAFAGRSYSLLQRVGAIVRNGSKLFAVGTAASLIGTGATNALITARKKFEKNYAGDVENVPILATSAAYGVYMAVSSNLRYQILAGVIEQRLLEPLLHSNKLLLSALCFAVRTGNTFLGSLLWVDYARWVGVQRKKEYELEQSDD